MSLHDDVLCQILQWLPVTSLLRFKLVCRTWCALIESYNFIKQHLHHHRYDPNLKDKNHSLIHIVRVDGKDSTFTFPLISIDSFEGPNTCVQLDCSDLREYFPLELSCIVSYNGIVCLNFSNCKGKHSICLWNPATKQSRILPQSPAHRLEMEHSNFLTMVGFGFDVENNDYKVVNLCRISHPKEERVEVYSLNTDSWRSVTTDFPFNSWFRNPKTPFNNGTCFFWHVSNFRRESMILCFDFSFEKIRSISFPNASNLWIYHNVIVVSDKIACVFSTNDYQTEIWVFNGYGSVNESWVKLYTMDLFSVLERGTSLMCRSMNGNYLFFTTMGRIGRPIYTKKLCVYNGFTKEIKNLSTAEICRGTCSKDGLNIDNHCSEDLVEFKESMLSVGKGKNE